MEDSLMRMKDVILKLEADGLVTVSKQAFSQAVIRGTMPHRMSDRKQKRYDYSTVVYVIKSEGLFGYTPDADSSSEDEDLADVYERFLANPTLTDANIIKTITTTKREQLKLEEEQGKLISREEVENKAFTVTRTIRDKILSIPERMSNELASMDDPHQVKELLYKEFGLMLDGFSKESFL